MKLTSKGQVTIPKHIRQLLGIGPHSHVAFISENDRVYIERADEAAPTDRFEAVRGSATVRMSTDEIMALTRGGD